MFISEDPVRFAAGDYNLHRFVGNSPVNFSDPFGLDAGAEGATVNSQVTAKKAALIRGMAWHDRWIAHQRFFLRRLSRSIIFRAFLFGRLTPAKPASAAALPLS